MKQKAIVALFLILFFTNLFVCAFDIESRPTFISDEKLRQAATEQGLVPENPSYEYLQAQISQGNSVIVWIFRRIDDKIALVGDLRRDFAEKEGATIKNRADYYANKINLAIYNSIFSDKSFVQVKDGIRLMFESIAVQEGDYDTGDGRSKIEVLRDYLGKDKFRQYKKKFPDRYKALAEMDKQARKLKKF